MRPKYFIRTWDMDKQRYTPQPGVRCGPYSLFGLRKPLRALRRLGYACRRHDSFVYVARAGL